MSCTNTCESNEIKYKGNGSQVLFTFPFTYIDEGDVKVSLWNEDTKRWEITTDWTFANATTIEFTTAPAAPTEDVPNIRIGRCTSIDPLSATFYPGSAIRAQDLNDNFEQLQLAIQEGRCQVPDWLFDYLDKYYWNKYNETIYSGDTFECTDDKIPSAGAVCEKIEDAIDSRLVTEADQKAGRWTKFDPTLNNDEKIATTAAVSERHDPFFQDTVPTPVPTYRIPGRRWIDTDDVRDYVWNQDVGTWEDYSKAGPKGDKGDTGTYKTIVSDNPPAKRNSGDDLQNGDIWFNSELGEAFIWYTQPSDPDSSQWVSLTKPGPAGVPGGNIVYNFVEPLEEDVDNNVSFNLSNLIELN